MSSTALDTRLRASSILRAVWPRNTAKLAASAAGLSPRTVQAWLSERCTPSFATLARMAHRNDNLRAELIRRLTEINDDSMAQMVLPVAIEPADGEGQPRHGQRPPVAQEG